MTILIASGEMSILAKKGILSPQPLEEEDEEHHHGPPCDRIEEGTCLAEGKGPYPEQGEIDKRVGY
jgi:hypothetical protein